MVLIQHSYKTNLLYCGANLSKHAATVGNRGKIKLQPLTRLRNDPALGGEGLGVLAFYP